MAKFAQPFQTNSRVQRMHVGRGKMQPSGRESPGEYLLHLSAPTRACFENRRRRANGGYDTKLLRFVWRFWHHTQAERTPLGDLTAATSFPGPSISTLAMDPLVVKRLVSIHLWRENACFWSPNRRKLVRSNRAHGFSKNVRTDRLLSSPSPWSRTIFTFSRSGAQRCTFQSH